MKQNVTEKHRCTLLSVVDNINTPVGVFLLFFYTFFLHSLWAQTALPQENRLPNGLRVVTYEMHHAPLIFLGMIYDASPRNEHIGITGISHMLEHMMFMGTKNYPGDRFIRQLREKGASLNGFTTTDFTAYYDFFPAEFLNEILSMEADRMVNLQLDSLTFLKEREVVKNERRRKLDNSPRALIEADFKNLFYRTHPYRNPTIGYTPDIDNYSIKKLRRYYNSYYRPENACLVLVGDFRTETILQQVQQTFNFRKPGPLPDKPAIFELPPAGYREVTYRSSVFNRPEIRFNFHIPAISHPDAPALDALMFVLGRPSSELGRLKNVLVEKKKIAVSAGTAGFSFRDAGFLSMRITTEDSANFPQIYRTVREIVRQLQQKPVNENELTAYKIKTRYLLATRKMAIRDFGEKLIYYIMQGGWKYRLVEEPAIKEKLTAEDIRRVAGKYLDFDRCFVEYRLPAAKKAASPRGEIESETNHFGTTDYFEHSSAVQKTTEPNPPAFTLSQQLKKTVLPSGIQVYQLKNPSSGLWGFRGFWKTGNVVENDSVPGVGKMLAALLRGDTRKHRENELKRTLQFYQVRQGFGGGNLDFMTYGESLPEYADTLLTVFRERISYPLFSTEKIQKYAERAQESEKNRRKNQKAVANEAILKLLFPGHPYSREYQSKAETLGQVKPALLEAMWRKYFRAENLTLLIYGSLDSLSNIRLVEKYFDKLPGTRPSPAEYFPVPIAPPVPAGKRLNLPNPGAKVAEIRLGFSGPVLSHPDALAFRLVGDMLARGSVTSYLGKVLRNQMGLTYYIGLNREGGPRPFGGSLIIQSQVANENVPKFLATACSLLQQFPDDLTPHQWEDTRHRLHLSYLKKWDNFENVAEQVFATLRNGQSPLILDDYIQQLNRITFKDIQRVARKYIDPARMIVLIYGSYSDD